MNGGGFYINTNSVFELNNSLTIITFLNNTSEENGGAIYTNNINSFKIVKSSINIIQNSAANGGCIYFTSTANPIIIEADLMNFLNNTAIYDAGCLHLTNDNSFSIEGTDKTKCIF